MTNCTRESQYTNILCTLLGGVLFLSLYGHQVLDPTFIYWTMKGDAAIHFLGWHFFRSEPWSFPLGAIKSYMYPQGTSVVFTDSIPLLAIPLKLFSPLLPQPFQYHGLWLLINYMLQGFFGAKLLRLITRNPALIIIGVLFFLLSPIMTNKAAEQEALTSHWLLLAALYLYLCPAKTPNQRNWLGLLISSALIHFYLFFMVGVFWTAYLLRMKMEGNTTLTILKIMAVPPLVILLTMWTAGYFVIPIDSAPADGFGDLSMNLLAPFFPTIKYPFSFPSPLTPVCKWQSAGENYLGMGALLMMALALYEQTAHHFTFDIKKHLPLIIAALLLFFLAITHKITFSDSIIFEIPLPPFVRKIMSVIRASGRMFWPVAYLLIVTAISVINKFNSPKRATFIVAAALAFQIIDFWPWYSRINLANKHIFQSPLQSSEWEIILKDIDHIAITPPLIDGDDYIPFAWLAANHRKTINVGGVARSVKETSSKNLLTDFQNGALSSNTLYILKDSRFYTPHTAPNIKLQVLDGIHVATATDNSPTIPIVK